VFLWDDLLFLNRMLTFRLPDLLPDPRDDFYRPVSRQLYFGIVGLLRQPLLAHFMNALLAGMCAFLIFRVGSRLMGKKAGWWAAVAFSCLGQLPLLIGWICGAQDLLALLFFLLALELRLTGRDGGALAAAAIAILCKETVVSLLPALAFLDWILARRPSRTVRNLVGYGAIVIVWAFIHPGIRNLLAHRLETGTTGYLGTRGASSVMGLLRYVLAAVNIPTVGKAHPLPPVYYIVGAAALVVIAIGARLSAKTLQAAGANAHSLSRTALLGTLLFLPPLAMTAMVVKHWIPYYVVAGSVGSSLLLGMALGRMRFAAATACVAVLLALGLWARSMSIGETLISEPNFRATSRTLRGIEAGFRTVRPRFEPNTQAVISVQTGGALYQQMYQLQPLRVWYHDPTLWACPPTERTRPDGPEALLSITAILDVVDIDPDTYAIQSSGGETKYIYVETALRLYALGLARSGDTDRAVQILIQMPEYSRLIRVMHQRLAAALLLVAHRNAEAERILDSVPPLPTEYAIEMTRRTLSEPGISIDEEVMRAFGVQAEDPATIRSLLDWFVQGGYDAAALRFAERLEGLQPGDPAALAARRQARSRLAAVQVPVFTVERYTHR
jgi:hypothetical protein